MAGKTTFEIVRKLGRHLPGVEESTMFGQPALKVRGRMFACLPSHKSAEPDSLVVRMDFEQRAELLAADPAVYYIKEHYEGYPAVLVRLARVQPDALRDLLAMAHRFVLREARKPRQSRSGAGR